MEGTHFRAFGLVGQVGCGMVVSILLGLAVGLWIDNRFGTSPFGALIFIGLGILVGSIQIYRLVETVMEETAKQAEQFKKDGNG